MNTRLVASADGPSASVVVNRRNAALKTFTALAGRTLLALLFLLSGLGKLAAYKATAAYMVSAGVPGAILPAVIAIEVLGALAIIVGWKTRAVASLLAGFSVLTALVFHNNFADPIQMIMFWKNMSIAGGFLLLIVNGAGSLSVDAKSAR